MKIFAVLTLVLFAAAASGCSHGKSSSKPPETQKIGDCEIETITIGTGTQSAAHVPDDAAWIRVSSVAFAGNDVYKQAASDLQKVLADRGVSVYGSSELTHVKSGSCWPPYAVEMRVKLTEQAGEQFHKFLLEMPIASHRPTADRPEDYGPFFITCGSGATDWWTVWFVR